MSRLGYIYRRKRRDKRTGKIVEGDIWWIKYYRHGKPYRESTNSDKITVAQRLLKIREGQIAEGKLPGIHFEKVIFEELAEDELVEAAVLLQREGVVQARHEQDVVHAERHQALERLEGVRRIARDRRERCVAHGRGGAAKRRAGRTGSAPCAGVRTFHLQTPTPGAFPALPIGQSGVKPPNPAPAGGGE